MIQWLKTKTWKREVAVAIFALFWYTVLTGDIEMVKVLVYPVFTFGALCFGLDWHSKQLFKNP